VDVERIGHQLSQGRNPAGRVDGLGIAGSEQQLVGPFAPFLVRSEERGDVPQQFPRQGRLSRTPAKVGQRHGDEQIFRAASGDSLPLGRIGGLADQRERPPE